MSAGNDYHVTSNPYTALTLEYAGEDLDAIPGLLAKVVAMINKELIAKFGHGLKDEEIAFLETKCTVVQAVKIWGGCYLHLVIIKRCYLLRHFLAKQLMVVLQTQ